jgi:hypothetical protein
MSLPALPTHAQLRAAPQLAALAILDAALLTAEEALLAHHPARDDFDGDLHGPSPPPDHLLAAILVARLDELHHLLGRYNVAVRTSLRAANDDFPF